MSYDTAGQPVFEPLIYCPAQCGLTSGCDQCMPREYECPPAQNQEEITLRMVGGELCRVIDAAPPLPLGLLSFTDSTAPLSTPPKHESN